MKYLSYNSETINEEIVQQMADLYWRDFVGADLRDESPEFYSKERFYRRVFENYMKAPGFQIAICWDGQHLVGFATAANLRKNTVWWDGVHPARPKDKAIEDGKTTLAIFDILVASSRRGQGIAKRLHKELLDNAVVKRSTLLSSAPQQPAYSIWRHWGYEIVGKKKMENGPELDVFLLQL